MRKKVEKFFNSLKNKIRLKKKILNYFLFFQLIIKDGSNSQNENGKLTPKNKIKESETLEKKEIKVKKVRFI